MPVRSWALACLAVLSLFALIEAVKKEDFKTCSQSAFCRRNRALADSASADAQWVSPYTLVKDSIRFSNDFMTADIYNKNTDNLMIMELQVLNDNTVRVRMDEKTPIHPRYKDHAQFTLVDEAKPIKPFKSGKNTDGIIKITLDSDGTRKILVTPSPLRVEFLMNEEPIVTLNDRGLFNFEHLRTKETHKPKMIKQTNEDGTEVEIAAEEEKDLWEETFRTWTDPKPRGPESIGLDITFNGFEHVYGIPVSNSFPFLCLLAYIVILANSYIIRNMRLVYLLRKHAVAKVHTLNLTDFTTLMSLNTRWTALLLFMALCHS
jgi:alpha 1,3-glucosidase